MEPYVEPASETYTKDFIKNFGIIDQRQDWNLVAQLARQNRGRSSRAVTVVPETSPVGVTTETLTGERGYLTLSPEEMMSYQEKLPEEKEKVDNIAQTNLEKEGITKDFFVNADEFWLFPQYWDTGSWKTNEIGIYYYVDSNVDGAEKVSTYDGVEKYIVRVPVFQGKLSKLLQTIKDSSKKDWINFNGDGDPYGIMEREYWPSVLERCPEKCVVVAEGNTMLIYSNGSYNSNWVNGGERLLVAGTDEASGEKKYIKLWECMQYEPALFTEILGNELIEIAPDKFKVEGSQVKYLKITEGEISYHDMETHEVKSQIGEDKNGTFVVYSDVAGARSWGTRIKLDRKISFGFYIKQGDWLMYSESLLNKKLKFDDRDEPVESSYVCTYINPDSPKDSQGNTKRYLCFEDWPIGENNDNKNFDLNDMVFRVYGLDDPDSEIVDKDKPDPTPDETIEEGVVEEGLLVCEDLGATDDIDFNDVVLKLQHIRTVKTTTVGGASTKESSDRFVITPMAAGGTLKSTVYYKDEKLGEIHNLLGGNAPTVINATDHQVSRFGEPFEYNLTAADWDDEQDSKYDGYVSKVFGEKMITIKTLRGKEMDSEVLISAPGIGEAPQMMLLPAHWWWPQERNSIEDVYPGFMDWVKDFQNNKWIHNHEGGTKMHVKHCEHPEDLDCCKKQ